MTDDELWEAKWLQFKLAVMDKVFHHNPPETVPNWEYLRRHEFPGRVIIEEIAGRIDNDVRPMRWSAMVSAFKHAGIRPVTLKNFKALVAAAKRVEPHDD